MDPRLHRHLSDDGEVLHLAPLLFELLAAVPLSYYLLALLLVLSVALYNFLEFHVLADITRGWRGDKVGLTYNHASELSQYFVSKCRILHGRYLATPWLANPHFQTAFLNFFGNPPAFRYRRHIFHTPDGGSVALDWLLSSDVLGSSSNTGTALSKEDTTPIVIVIPGLTSDSTSSYVKHMVYKMAKRGWNVVVMNHRGLGGMSITSDCFYNAGWTEDLRIVINHLYQHHPHSPLFAIGTSIGANVLVKYLGEEGENTPIAGASSVCSPWDLVVCDRFISRRLVQRFYDRVLAIGLKGYAQLHQPVMSRLADWEGIKRSRSVRDFDNYATCLVAKYETVDTYYRRCSSAGFVGTVSVPLLCISALDDPVCTKEAIPWDECRANKNIILATTTHGGHLAFFQGIRARKLWWVGAVDEFLSVLHSSPYMHKKKRQVTGLHSSLESTIDKSPYVNVMEDGMLTAVVNDELNFENENPDGSSSNQSADEHKAFGADVEETERQTPAVPLASATEQIFQEQPGSSEHEAPKDSSMVSVTESLSLVKKALNQLSRYSSKSFWLLAYIAIVTTWPLLGSALRILFNKKLKRMRKTA